MNRMHPEDLRAIVAAQVASGVLACSLQKSVKTHDCVGFADSLLTELACTVRQEPKFDTADLEAAKAEGAKEERKRIANWFDRTGSHLTAETVRRLEDPKL